MQFKLVEEVELGKTVKLVLIHFYLFYYKPLSMALHSFCEWQVCANFFRVISEFIMAKTNSGNTADLLLFWRIPDPLVA